MKSTTKLQLSILGLTAIIAAALFAVFVLAPSITWTSGTDWTGGTFANTTNITGDLMLNNTIQNGTQTFYSWFYNNWTYRRAITINGSTALQNDYQVNLSINSTIIPNLNWSAFGNDTRFTWLNTSNGMEQNISFWIENWTNISGKGNASLWIKVPNITAWNVANTTIYMYYGNPSAKYNNTLGGNNTFEFFDYIDSAAGWDGGTANTTDYYSAPASVYATASGSCYEPDPEGADCSGSAAKTANKTATLSSGTKIAEYYAKRSTSSNTCNLGTTHTSRLNVGATGQTFTDAVWTSKSFTFTDSGIVNVSIYSYASGGSNPQITCTFNTITKGDSIRIRKYATPEPAALLIGGEQVARNKGTYLSNTTTYSGAIGAITAIWNASNSSNVNFTVDISANAGSSWCGNVVNNTQYTSANSCGGIGSGTELVYRINFSTNDTNKTAVIYDITVNYQSSIPQWSTNATSKPGGTQYGASNNYGFQINWTDENDNFDNATFQLGKPNGLYTNYTKCGSGICTNNNSAAGPKVWYINLTQNQLGGVGTYNYTWFGTGISGAQNSSDTVGYIINQAPLQIIVSPQTQSVSYPASILQYCSNNLTSVSCSLYRNATLLTNDTNIVLGAGAYNFTANITDTANHTIYQNSSLLTVSQNSTNPVKLYFRNSTGEFLNQNMSVVYGTQTNSTTVLSYSQSGPANLYYNHTLNNTLNNTNAVLSVGVYNITANTTGNANYTGNSTSYLLTVNKAQTLVQLFFNGTESDRAIYSPNITNITGSVNFSGKTVYIDANFSGAIQQIASGADSATNFTNLSNLAKGVYNITAYVLDTQNLTGTLSQTYYLTVRGRLNITIETPASSAILNRTYPYWLNATVRDDNGAVTGANMSWFVSEVLANSSNNTYNYNWTVPAAQAIGATTIKANASKTYYDSAENSTSIEVWRALNVSLTAGPAQIYRNDSFSPYSAAYTANVTDENGAVSSIQVTFRRGATLVGVNNTAADGTASKDDNPSDATTTPGVYAVTANVTSPSASIPYSYRINGTSNITVKSLLFSAITSPSANAKYYKNQTITASSATNNENGGATSPESAEWALNGTGIISGESGSWQIPAGQQSGTYFLNYSAYKQYYDNSSANVSVRIWGYLLLSNMQNNSIIHRGDILQLNSSVRDEEPPNSIINFSVSWFLNGTNITGGNETSWSVPINQALGPYLLNATVTSPYLSRNSTALNVYGWTNTTAFGGAGAYPAGASAAVSCAARDANTSAAIESYPIRFYKNSSLQATNYTNSSGYAFWYWDTSLESAGTYNVTCGIADNSTLYYNASTANQSGLISVTRNLTIDQIVRDQTTIYRGDAYTPKQANISVHVSEAALGNSGAASVDFYNSSAQFGSCATNSSGWCAITYNPQDTITPGNYTFLINASKGGFSNSSTNSTWIVVKGVVVSLVVDNPAADAGFHKTDAVSFNASELDENGGNPAVIVNWYNSSGSLIATGVNAQWNIPANYRLGRETISANTTADTYYDSASASVNINISGWSNVSWLSPSGTQIFGNTLALNCSVRDANSSALISGYNVSFYRNGTYINSNLTSGGFSTVYWNPALADYSMRCNITNNSTLNYTVSVQQAQQTLSVRDMTKPFMANTSLLHRSMDIGQNQTINANITDDVEIDEVWVALDVPPANETDNATYFNYSMSLAVGNSTVAYYELNYTPQKGGIYNVTVFANDTAGNINSSLAGNFSVPKNTTGYVFQQEYIEVGGVNSTDSMILALNLSLVNTGNTSMTTSLILLTSLPSGWSSANMSLGCGTVAKLTNCSHTFNLTIPAGATPGNYTISSEGRWKNYDGTFAYFGNFPVNQSAVNITNNPMLNITANNFSATVGHGNESAIGTFTIQSLGNGALSRIFYNRTSGNLSAGWVEFETTPFINYIPSLAANLTRSVSLNVTVPATEIGYYTAGFIVNATNSTCSGTNCWKIINVSVTVPADWGWSVSPAGQTSIVYQNQSGNLTNITITNTGNRKINFTVTKSGNASSLIALSDSSASMENQTAFGLRVNYSIPLAQQFGIYNANISISNSSASPAQINYTIILDVRDTILPTVNNTNLSAATLEANYNALNISADAFDNFALSAVWAEITLPSAAKQNLSMSNISANTYRANYTPSAAGVYNVTVFANDTSNNANSAYAGNFTAIGATSGFNRQNPQSVTASNITQTGKYSFTINATLNNTGSGTMRFVNFTLSFSDATGFEANASSAQCYNLSAGASCLQYFAINVTAAASPAYPVITGNFSWQNPDYSTGYAGNSTTVTINSNPMLNISETSLSASFGHGNSSVIGNFTILSDGNYRLDSIQLSGSGNLSGWLSFSPSSVSTIAKGANRTINVTASVPLGQAAGTYIASVMANASGVLCTPAANCWDNITVSLTVPQDWSWNITQQRIPASGNQLVPVETSGSFLITVNNTGNLNLNLTLTQSGNATDNLLKTPSPLAQVPVIVTKQNHTNVTFTYDSSGMLGGNYTLDIRVANASASPAELHAYAYFDVRDIPPVIGNITVSPAALDQNYQSVLIQADASDNGAVDKVWANITRPSGSEIVLLDRQGSTSTYNSTYVPSQGGSYSVSIYANDTLAYRNNSQSYGFTSIGSTFMSVSPNATQVSVSGVTQTSGASVPLNITFNNIGQGGAYFTNLSFDLFPGWSASPSAISYNNISNGSSRSNASTILIPAGALGQYPINATATWSNPNNTIWTNRTQINITVLSNPQLDIAETAVNITVNHGASNSTNFTINATGNDALSGASFACQSGALCTNSNFTISFSPPSVSSLSAGAARNISVSATAALGTPPGLYAGTINASASGASDTAQIGVLVPGNGTWGMSQSWSGTATVGTGSSGSVGTITLTNYGNQPLLFAIAGNGNGTSYINVSQSNLTVAGQSSGIITVNYYAPASIPDSIFTVYSLNVSITNSTANPAQQASSANIKVMKFNVRIFSPSSQVSVIAGDSVPINANATYGDSALADNITWAAAFNSTSCPISSSATSLDAYNNIYWRINCTAPNVADANNYTLILTGNYTTYSALTTDSKANIIVYPDKSKPKIPAIAAPSITPGNNVPINASLTDNVAVVQAIAQVTYPNASAANFTLANVSSNLSSTSWILNFSDTSQVGDYDVRIFAKDNENNWNYSDGWFEAYPNNVTFSGTAQSAADAMQLNLYRSGKSGALYLIHSISSNASSGNYSAQVRNRTYDIEAKEYGNAVKLLAVPIGSDQASPLLLKDVAVSKVGSNILRVLAVSNNLSFGSANVTLNYTGSSGYTESALRVFKCANWSYSGESCNSTWVSLGGSANGDSTITANTSSFSAFAVSKNSFVCGDGVCDTSNGETASNCATDGCAAVQQNAGTGGSTGTGTGTGSGSGAGGASSAPPAQKQEENLTSKLKLPDTEISTNNLEVTLHPGESVITSIDVTNNLDSAAAAEMAVEGRIWEFVQFENASLTLQPKSASNLKVKFTASDTTLPGIYTGDIFIKTGNRTQRISTTMKVEEKREALMDVKIEALTKEINPGQPLRSQVTLYNMGMTKKIDVTIGYTVRDIYTDKIAAKDSETLAIENSLSFVRTIGLPKDIKLGKYTIEAIAYYENKTAIGVSSFEVVETPAIILMLIAFATSWYPYAIVAAVVAAFLIRKLIRKIRLNRIKNAKYIFPVDYKKLPKTGIKVGKIAETDVDAYLDENKLTTHLLLAGGTGSGKSVTAMVIAEEVLKKGIPVIVFDPTAQWTGFIKSCRDERMFALYPKFGIRKEEARAFKGAIIDVTDPKLSVDIEKYLNKGEITVFNLNKMFSADLDSFVRKTIDNIFAVQWKEARELKVLIIYDEVHRLLPKYGGKGGYTSLERGAREFRKWGIGLMMISQVLLDFRGAVRAVIASEGQLRTKYEGDISRVKTKYGAEYAATIPKLQVGTILFQNPEYNDGKPWFISFRPLLHDTSRIPEEELQQYKMFEKKIAELETMIAGLKAKKAETYDIEIELNLAKEKVKQGQMRMAQTYIDSIEARLKKHAAGK